MTVRVCVVGASGFGAIHVRELLRAGATISGIVGSSEKTANETARRLSEKFAAPIKIYTNIDAAINDAPDGVVVSCPATLHLAILTAPWQKNTKFLCEKPLFWDKDTDLLRLRENIQKIGDKIGERMAYNCNNLFYLQPTNIKKCRSMEMEFFTNSKHKGLDIAIDLLPHAIGFAQTLAPAKIEIISVKKELHDTETRIECDLGSIVCNFHFCNDASIPKRLSFTLDGEKWFRKQDDSSGRCRTFLHKKIDQETEIEDPMFSVAKGFFSFLQGNPLSLPNFDFAAENLETCWRLINFEHKNGAFVNA